MRGERAAERGRLALDQRTMENWEFRYFILLYYIILNYIMLYYIKLYYVILYYIILYYIIYIIFYFIFFCFIFMFIYTYTIIPIFRVILRFSTTFNLIA